MGVKEMCVNLRYSAHLDIVTLDIEALLLTAASAPIRGRQLKKVFIRTHEIKRF